MWTLPASLNSQATREGELASKLTGEARQAIGRNLADYIPSPMNAFQANAHNIKKTVSPAMRAYRLVASIPLILANQLLSCWVEIATPNS